MTETAAEAARILRQHIADSRGRERITVTAARLTTVLDAVENNGHTAPAPRGDGTGLDAPVKEAIDAVWKCSLIIESSVRRGDGPMQYAEVLYALSLVKEVRAALAANVENSGHTAPAPRTVSLGENQIKHMVSRFLQWRLPEPFRPDAGISFTPYPTEPFRSRHWPVGTNLFGATEAEQMVRHMLEGLPRGEWSYSGKLIDELHDEIEEVLEQCADYLDNRSDADHDGDGFVPNREMTLLSAVKKALERLEQNYLQGLRT